MLTGTMGGDLPTLDAATRALLTNPEVLAVNQHGRASCIASDGEDLLKTDWRFGQRRKVLPVTW